MTFRKKTIIAACSMVFVCLIAIVSVVAILAASSATIRTKVEVTYTSTIVSGNYKFSYKNAGDDWQHGSVVDVSSSGENPNYDTLSLNDEIIWFDENSQYFIMRWEIQNTNTEGNRTVIATLDYVDTVAEGSTETSDDENLIITVYYAIDDDIENESEISGQPGADHYVTGAVIEPNQKLYVYVKIQIDEIKKDACFSGDFTWTLENGETLPSA